MLSCVSSAESSDTNFRVRRAVRATLAVASLMLFASLQAQAQDADAGTEAPRPDEDVTALSNIEVTQDPTRFLPSESSGSSFGFNKPLLETPRSVSFISREQIDLYDLSSVADLGRVVAGVYTPARYGIQGSIDIRGVPADTYLRGMKRVVLQGNARSVLAAMDVIEVVKGPPSPIFGIGKIGGYTNFVPKSGRAGVGGYLAERPGLLRDASCGTLRSPRVLRRRRRTVSIGGKKGGYYVYGLLDDSQSYYVRDAVQAEDGAGARRSFDNFVGPFRLETGAIYQDRHDRRRAERPRRRKRSSTTSRYIERQPAGAARPQRQRPDRLARDESGLAGARQSERRQSAAGADVRLATDASGNYLPLEQFPKVQGIPQTMYDYLVAHPGSRPDGAAARAGRRRPAADVRPAAGRLRARPAHRRLRQLKTCSARRASAHERELNAQVPHVFADLVYDANPDFTMKNQLFFDSIDQYKISNQPLR